MMALTPDEITRLREAVEKATKGPREVSKANCGAHIFIRWRDGSRHAIAWCDADAGFIATDPSTILALLAERDAALARIAELEDWRPIETAPKDGTRFIVWHREFGVHFAHRPSEGTTHWLPLPKPARAALTPDTKGD